MTNTYSHPFQLPEGRYRFACKTDDFNYFNGWACGWMERYLGDDVPMLNLLITHLNNHDDWYDIGPSETRRVYKDFCKTFNVSEQEEIAQLKEFK